jgi:anaerobic selenocysteine-containing dehydrogenase
MAERIGHGSHWGAFDAVVEDGRFVAAEPPARDPAPSPILKGMPAAVYHRTRVARPSIRKGWLERGFMAGGEGRGREPFVDIPWDEAIDLVSSELRRVKGEYGNDSIFAGSYGWASAGRYHHAKTQLQRFMNCYGGFTAQKHSWPQASPSCPISSVILPPCGHPLHGPTSNNTPVYSSLSAAAAPRTPKPNRAVLAHIRPNHGSVASQLRMSR